MASPTNSSSYQIDMDGDVDTIQVSSDSSASQRKTNFFTGLVYNQTVFDWQPKRESVRFVYLDGSTRINQNFRFRHVLSESWVKPTPDSSTQHGNINFTLAPRYEQWVSPSFSWFAEPVFIRQTEASSSNTSYELKFKPGAQFTFGQHFISTTADYAIKWRERYGDNNDSGHWDSYSMDVNYVNRYSRSMNFGISGSYSATPDNDVSGRRRNHNFKPFVRVRHMYDITTELNTVIGREESGPYWNGYDYVRFNVNNNKRLTNNLRLVANFQYGDNKRVYNGGFGKNGDKQEMQVRIGANITL
ncbi:hypothetical protein [Photobacterium rosenbergii]|uniref:Porin n=1 Tax=Photobacterium rosenbergii TaxID=294936 RepID=A0ABU3ZHC9_9GAMM|nr:hypothetical protein [Photobacterium rosenbergii]MDV5169533.1 hypothetical protein [Photobacterium rosenbergii]